MNSVEEKIAGLLSKYGGYKLLEEISEKQRKVIKGVRDTGKSGKIVITLGFKRKGSHDIIIGSKVAATIPELDAENTVLYVDKDNDLHEGNPDQITTYGVISSISQKKEVNEI